MDDARTPRGPHTPDRPGRTRIVLCSLLGVLLLIGGAAAYTWHRLNRNISGVELGSLLTPAASATSDLNILIVGSDSRAGKNATRAGGGDDTGRSDTTLLLHVYGGRKKAALVSIPRDTIVDRPACTTASGTKLAAREGVMFNSVYETGGAPCAVAAVEALSGGLRVNHYVEVGFNGFAELMDALGGTDITLAKPIDDKESGLHLPAGKHHLNGQQALDLVRTRHGVGNGSDLGRIQLQHQFLTVLIGRLTGGRLLSDPAGLFDGGRRRDEVPDHRLLPRPRRRPRLARLLDAGARPRGTSRWSRCRPSWSRATRTAWCRTRPRPPRSGTR